MKIRNLITFPVFWSLVIVLSFSGPHSLKSQDFNQFKTIFIYNFCKYIEWPPSKQDSNEILIGVYGKSDVTPYLKVMAGRKKLKNRSFRIIEFSRIEDIEDCHVLLIDPKRTDDVRQIKEKIDLKGTLTITDLPGAGNSGSMINFTDEDGKPRFELNLKETEKNQLRVSQELLRLAILI